MGRLIDADLLTLEQQSLEDVGQGVMEFYSKEQIDQAPTIEAIPKADYENRLKADMATIKQLSNSIKALQKANSEIAVAYDKFKADYEARLKADMMAILKDIKLKIKKKSYHDTTIIGNYEDEMRVELVELDDVNDIIQDKISTLEVENGEE